MNQANRLQYVEPIPCEEQIASGPAVVECIDNGVFIMLYVDHILPPEFGGERARRICQRIVLPRAGAARLCVMIEECLESGKAARRTVDGSDENLAETPAH